MFAERLVPDRRHLDAALGGSQARAQLRLRLMREAVAYPERVFLQPQSVTHALLLNISPQRRRGTAKTLKLCPCASAVDIRVAHFMTAARAGSTLRSSLATTRPKTTLPRSPRCVYSISRPPLPSGFIFPNSSLLARPNSLTSAMLSACRSISGTRFSAATRLTALA